MKKEKELQGVISPTKIGAEPGRILKPLSKTVKHPWIFIVVLIIIALPGYLQLSEMRATYDPTGELLETQDITKAFRTVKMDRCYSALDRLPRAILPISGFRFKWYT